MRCGQVLLAGVLLLCGCPGVTETPFTDPLEDACYAYRGQTVDTLETYITLDRDNGWSYEQELWIVTQGCLDNWGAGTAAATACVDCLTAVTKHVYGVE